MDLQKDSESRPTRNLGLFDVIMVGIGTTIGTGVILLPGISARLAGPALIFGFLLNGLLVLSALKILHYAPEAIVARTW